MRLNPTAVIMWVFCGLIGWLVGDTTGAVVGVAAGLALSMLAAIIP